MAIVLREVSDIGINLPFKLFTDLYVTQKQEIHSKLR